MSYAERQEQFEKESSEDLRQSIKREFDEWMRARPAFVLYRAVQVLEAEIDRREYLYNEYVDREEEL